MWWRWWRQSLLPGEPVEGVAAGMHRVDRMSWVCRGEHPARVSHVVVVMWRHDARRRRAHVGSCLGHAVDVHVIVAVAVAVAMAVIAVAVVVIAGMLHVWRGLVDTRGAVMMFLLLVVVLVLVLLLVLLLVNAVDVIESWWHSPDAVEAAFYTATTRLLL